MVGIGMLMILTGAIAIVLHFKKRLFDTRWFQYWCMALTPSGFVAVLAGWFVTEVGRQPWIIHNVMRSSESVSPVVSTSIAISLAAFVFTYLFVFGAGTYYSRLHPTGVWLSRIACGMPLGGDLEYADHVTVARSLENRRKIQ